MKSLNKPAISFFVISVVLAGVANAADVNVNLNDNVNNPGTFIQIQGTDNTAYNLDNIKGSNVQQDGQIYNLQGDIAKANIAINNAQDTANTATNKADAVQTGVNTNAQLITSLNQKVEDNQASQTITDGKQDILINDTEKKANTALQGVVKNGADIIGLQNQNNLQGSVLANHDQRITSLENAPKPTNGVDGKDGAKGDTGATGATGANGKDGLDGKNGVDGINGKDGSNGKDGVTTTINKVDAATQIKVAANSAAIASTSSQAASVAQDLQDAKKVFSQQQANTNAQFKSLHDEVDGNKKEARSGAASAIAIASMPQVEAGQKVMFSAGAGSFKDEQAVSVGASFHAGAATVKAGVSSSTNNDFALGAGVGFGF